MNSKLKILLLGLFVFMGGMSFGQTMTPKKMNKRLENWGVVVIKDAYKTTEFIKQVDGVSLIDGKLVADKGFEIIEGNGEDVLINTVRAVTVKLPGGGSITRSCGCEGGGGSCDVKATAGGKYSCEGSDCCSLITVIVSKGGDVEVER